MISSTYEISQQYEALKCTNNNHFVSLLLSVSTNGLAVQFFQIDEINF